MTSGRSEHANSPSQSSVPALRLHTGPRSFSAQRGDNGLEGGNYGPSSSSRRTSRHSSVLRRCRAAERLWTGSRSVLRDTEPWGSSSPTIREPHSVSLYGDLGQPRSATFKKAKASAQQIAALLANFRLRTGPSRHQFRLSPVHPTIWQN